MGQAECSALGVSKATGAEGRGHGQRLWPRSAPWVVGISLVNMGGSFPDTGPELPALQEKSALLQTKELISEVRTRSNSQP